MPTVGVVAPPSGKCLGKRVPVFIDQIDGTVTSFTAAASAAVRAACEARGAQCWHAAVVPPQPGATMEVPTTPVGEDAIMQPMSTAKDAED